MRHSDTTDEHLMRQVLAAIAKGMSKSKVCDQFGISLTTLNKWERRRTSAQRSISFRGHASYRDGFATHIIPLGIRNIKTESRLRKRTSRQSEDHMIPYPLADETSTQLKPTARFSEKHMTCQSQGWDPRFLEEIIGGWVGEPLERSPQPHVGKNEKLTFDVPEV